MVIVMSAQNYLMALKFVAARVEKAFKKAMKSKYEFLVTRFVVKQPREVSH